MKLNRKTQPLVYTRMALKSPSDIARQREQQDALLRDVVLIAYALGFVVFLFLVIG